MCAVASELAVSSPFASVENDPANSKDLDPSRVLVEAALLWGGDVLALAHARPKDAKDLRIADLALDAPAGGDLVVARRIDGVVTLLLPNGRRVPAGCRMILRLGRVALRVALVADDTVTTPRARPDGRVALAILAAAVLHFVVVGALVRGRASDASIEEQQRVELGRTMAAAEARAEAEAEAEAQAAAALAAPRADHDGAAIAQAPQPTERASAGNPSRTNERVRRRETRGTEARAAKPGTEEIASFGILALLAGDAAGERAGVSAFAADTGRSAMGNLFGTSIGDAQGFGGLELGGTGEGGGGPGAGIPLAGIGTVKGGSPDGSVFGQGFGCGCGWRRRSPYHRPFSIRWSEGDAIRVNGRLPPEAIQRVVRQSHGRMRACYEQGLLRDAGLEGRIAVKFVIDRSGAVAFASVEERSLPDASVAACVARAFGAMDFPEPTGGIVTVVYPLVFTGS